MPEFKIDRLGHGGDGMVLTPEGTLVFAPMALPTEVIEGTVSGDRVTDFRIVTPSEDRIKAPCAHYRACGGCNLMHATESFVAQWKSDLITSALRAQGIEATIEVLHTSPPRSRRRAKFAATRTKAGAIVGFNGRASHAVHAVPNCMLITPELTALLPVLEEITKRCASRRVVLEVTVTQVDGGFDLSIVGGEPPNEQTVMECATLCAQHHILRWSWNHDVLIQADRPKVQLGRALVPMPAGAFLQATHHGQSVLQDAVLSHIGSASKVADLFCGIGTLTFAIAQQADVDGFEYSRDMINALIAGRNATQSLKPIQGFARDLFKNPVLTQELKVYDAVVLDPPRAGAASQIREIAASGVPIVSYVSCSPQSFAKDAAQLIQAGYQMSSIVAVDQFRWSAHVELAACFTKEV